MNIKKKLTSRKLWAAIAGLVTGLAMVFGLDESIISTVAGAVTAMASVVAYIITEGKIDAEAIAGAVESVGGAVDAVKGESATNTIDFSMPIEEAEDK